MSDHMDRKGFLKKAGVATAGAAAVPGLLATEALARPRHHGTQRVWTFVAVDQAPPTNHVVQPRMFMDFQTEPVPSAVEKADTSAFPDSGREIATGEEFLNSFVDRHAVNAGLNFL